MRREIPDDAHVVLEQAEVYADGVVVIEIAEFSALNKFLNFSYRTSEQERVIHHDLEVLARSEVD